MIWRAFSPELILSRYSDVHFRTTTPTATGATGIGLGKCVH